MSILKKEGKRGRRRKRITWSENMRKWTDIKKNNSVCRQAENIGKLTTFQNF